MRSLPEGGASLPPSPTGIRISPGGPDGGASRRIENAGGGKEPSSSLKVCATGPMGKGRVGTAEI